MQLLAMNPFLISMKHKSLQDLDDTASGNGRIVVTRKQVACHEYPLADKITKMPLENRKYIISFPGFMFIKYNRVFTSPLNYFKFI